MIWLLWLPMTLGAPRIFPLVDPGLFVISGVKTCGGGSGYCLLGLDCTLDEDFLPDEAAGQHCEGLRSAFTPSAHFVCCRASNRSLYKPPIEFPAVMNTTIPDEHVTSRTTTLNVLENEIDQVLLKVAQSVDAVKKTPTTEPVQIQTDSVELRESVEQQSSTEEEEEMLADSPEVEDSQESQYEDDSQNSSVENDSEVEDSTLNQPPLIVTTMIGNDEYELSTDNNDISKSKDPTTNTVLIDAPNAFDESDSSDNKVSPGKPSEAPKIEQENLTKTAIEFTNQNQSPIKETSEGTEIGVMHAEKSTTAQENAVGGASSSETPIQNDIPVIDAQLGKDTKNNDLNREGSDSTNVTSESSKPDHETVSNESVNDSGKLATKTTAIPSLNTNSNNQMSTSKPLTHPEINEVLTPTTVAKDEDSNVIQQEKIKQHEIKIDTTGTNPIQTENPTVTQENQSVTKTTVSPTTKSPVTGQPWPPGLPNQGQSEIAESCSRAASRNCSQEVKFVFQTETLCFGSIFTADWVVTSASCALRIFRTGMVNVSVSPLNELHRGEVKTIVVHESYGEGAGSTGQEMESNNIGLVQLRIPFPPRAVCLPCLPTPNQDLRGANCTGTTNLPPTYNFSANGTQSCQECSRAISGGSMCVGRVRQMKDDYGLSYLTIPCDTPWEPRFTDSTGRGSGSPLFCDGLLAGVEASKGVGLLVYTPLTHYLPWLRHNTRPGPPEQHFNTG